MKTVNTQMLLEKNIEYIYNLCKPLFESSKITHFCYIKVLFKKRVLILCSDHKMAQAYFDQDITKNNDYQTFLFPSKNMVYVFWETMKNNSFVETIKTNSICNGLNIYREDEIFCFGTNKTNKNFVNEIISDLKLFDCFILYIKSSLKKIIDAYPRELLINIEKNEFSNKNNTQHNTIKDIFAKTKKFYFTNEIYLTKRQTQVLVHLAYGKSFALAGYDMGLNVRTIEKYFSDIKTKLQCHSKPEAINLFFNSELSCLSVDDV